MSAVAVGVAAVLGRDAEIVKGRVNDMQEGLVTGTDVTIRWLVRSDLPTVLDIETRLWDRPWDENDFLAALAQRSCIGVVAESGERVLGFLVYLLHKNSYQIVNMAVDPQVWRRGIGSRLVDRLINRLSLTRRNEVWLTVRETNVPAQLFLSACGFQATEVIREHYEDPVEDGYLMSFCWF